MGGVSTYGAVAEVRRASRGVLVLTTAGICTVVRCVVLWETSHGRPRQGRLSNVSTVPHRETRINDHKIGV